MTDRDEQLIRAALEMAATVAAAQMAPISGTPYAAGGWVFSEVTRAIRAIDVGDVLAGLRTRCAECDCGDGDCTWIAPGPAEEYEECICPAPCPIHPAPDAVARLVDENARLRNALHQIAHTYVEGGYGDMKSLPASEYQSIARAALAACKGVRDE